LASIKREGHSLLYHIFSWKVYLYPLLCIHDEWYIWSIYFISKRWHKCFIEFTWPAISYRWYECYIFILSIWLYKIFYLFWNTFFENSIPLSRISSLSQSIFSNLSIASFRASEVCGVKIILFHHQQLTLFHLIFHRR